MKSELSFYISLFLRRLNIFLPIVLIVSLIGVVAAFTLPTSYRAEARLVVESPQIPGELAASTVQAGMLEILEVIRQRIQTRTKLLDLAHRFEVYPADSELNPDGIVRDMRRRIQIELPLGQIGRALFVTVSFDDKDPQRSAQVTNELVTQILQQNIEMRTQVTGQTLDFFKGEVDRLEEELTRQTTRILEFKEEHKDALPDSLEYRRNRQAALQERVLQMERELSGLRDRRDRLIEIFDRTGRLDVRGDSLTPEQRQLQQLKDQLASALVIYSPENPRVKSLEAQIAALEAANIRLGLGTETAPNMTIFELELSDIDGQSKFILEQKRQIEATLEILNASIDATPTNAIALGTLERDQERIRAEYNEAAESLAEARTGDQIEAQSRGQRISVTEQATVPEEPASPNRKLVIAAGIGGGLGLGFAVLILLEILNSTIRRSSELTARFGVVPFGTVPLMQTPGQRSMRRLRLLAYTVGILAVLVAALYIIDMYIFPVGDLLQSASEHAGFDWPFAENQD